MVVVELFAHAQGFECAGGFVPREVYAASVSDGLLRGFVVSLTYWDFDGGDLLVNRRMEKRRHGLLFAPDDWSGVQFETLERELGRLLADVSGPEGGGGTVGVVDEAQRQFFAPRVTDRPVVVVPGLARDGAVRELLQDMVAVWSDPWVDRGGRRPGPEHFARFHATSEDGTCAGEVAANCAALEAAWRRRDGAS